MEQEIKKHPEHYPEEYITGSVVFFGREFRVTPDVLIPRLETEALVRRARKIQREKNYTSIVDIGTGSSIIGTSLADLVDEVILLDISPGALVIAEQNFRIHFPEKKASFILSNLLENIPKIEGKALFLANLPYIKGDDWEHMSADTHFEPELALFGGDTTGFELYEVLFAQLKLRNFSGICIIEFGFDQREIAERLIASYGWKYEFFADYAGIERFCEIELTLY